MIVYGDPQFEVSLRALTDRVTVLLEQAALPAGCGWRAEDAAARLLIACGQCEQGVEDAGVTVGPDVAAAARRLTDAAAEVYLDCIDCRGGSQADSVAGCRKAARAVAELARDLTLTVKVPEGYAFYRLNPRQYAAAARTWLREEHAAGESGQDCAVTVVGLRSIGTGLSAVVAGVVRRGARGARVRRGTLRPFGHPFERAATLPAELASPFLPGGGEWAIVVDEGPGLSGSSLAAAYAAVVDAGGFAPECVTLMPGHGGLPGAQGGESVRRIWASARRIVAAPGGESARVEALLRARSAELLGASPEGWTLHDIGGGAWRTFAYPGGDPGDWPAAAAQFERPKYLYRQDGAGAGGIVWTYKGFSEAPDASGRLDSRDTAALERLQARGHGPAVWGVAAGFIASPWVGGARLSGREAIRDPSVVSVLACHCAEVALPALGSEECAAAFERLREMLICNTREALGRRSAGRAARLAGAAWRKAKKSAPSVSSYGDGSMAPHEWVRQSGDGQIVKIDGAGGLLDHTMIGHQPFWWDLAGASVEWRLGKQDREALWNGCQGKLGMKQKDLIVVDDAVERFYRAAYAAFRMGLLTMCGCSSVNERAESVRRDRDIARSVLTLRKALSADQRNKRG